MFSTYVSLMNFMSKAIGPDFEISLIDTRNGKNKIIAMSYGNISGRHIGDDDISPIIEKTIENKEYENSDYIANQLTYSRDGKPLRTSLFFIKDDKNNLDGIMCLNFDDSKYIEFGRKLLEICHPDDFISNRLKASRKEEKIEIVKKLDNIGIFMMKGSVAILSKKLDVSQASVYRYINLAREEE